MIKNFKYKNKKRYQSGYSLIQILIYLIISSIILSISLNLLTCAINHKKIIENKLNNLTDKMILDNIISNLIIQKAYTKDEANKLYPGLDIKSDVILNSKNMLYFVSLNKGLISDKSNYGLFQFRLDSTEPKQLILKGVNAIALSYLDKDGKFSVITEKVKQNNNCRHCNISAKQSCDNCKVSSENLFEQKSKLRCLAYKNSNKSSSNIYQHFMLHALLNFQGDNFVYDLNLT